MPVCQFDGDDVFIFHLFFLSLLLLLLPPSHVWQQPRMPRCSCYMPRGRVITTTANATTTCSQHRHSRARHSARDDDDRLDDRSRDGVYRIHDRELRVVPRLSCGIHRKSIRSNLRKVIRDMPARRKVLYGATGARVEHERQAARKLHALARGDDARVAHDEQLRVGREADSVSCHVSRLVQWCAERKVCYTCCCCCMCFCGHDCGGGGGGCQCCVVKGAMLC